MKFLIAGAEEPSRELVAALAPGGPEPALLAPPDGSGPGVEALVAGLIEAERAIEAERPDAVLLADDSDWALATALVALKLLIPVEAIAAASEAPTVNGRLIAQLASTYTPPG